MGKKVTIQQIADYLGVSKFVVSRALSGKSGVKEETKMKVLEAAKLLGYTFQGESILMNEFKDDSYIQNKSGQQNVLVVLPRTQFQDSIYWGKIIDGISTKLTELSLSMVIITETDSFTSVINRQGLLGVICVGNISTIMLLEFKEWVIPVILIDAEEPLFTTNTIFANNYDSSYLLTNYLIGLGHKNVTFLGSIRYSRSFYDRWLGYRSALELKNINEHSIVPVNQTEMEYEDMLFHIKTWIEKEIKEGNELPTAFVCANDSIALYVINQLKDHGMNVPDDISVTGFDNIENSYLTSPTLTTVHVPKEQMGKRAIKSLLNQMNSEKENPEKVQLTCETMIRESTAKPRRLFSSKISMQQP